MEEIFIKDIHINKVRHLENIHIPISETERKHVILTGKNGSGKTSVLLEIRQWLNGVTNQQLLQIQNHKNSIKNFSDAIIGFKTQLEINPNDFETKQKLIQYENAITSYQNQIKPFSAVTVDFSDANIFSLFNEGNFILAHFGARRNLQINVPKGINKVALQNKYGVEDNAGANFVQYIVNLKADRSFARDDNDDVSIKQIDEWFHNFESSLRNIFGDEQLRLEFDRKNYNFTLINKDGEASDFTTLSDGYSTILNIISELIMRMENNASKSYDIQGIVLIDEIETHLHIDLQKKILPFLTSFFPKIQFVVTTHSPFVLNSVDNAVIYDLEKKLLVEDLSGYSVNAIIESYFDSDDYSEIVKEKVIAYERLLTKAQLSEDEKEALFDLKRYFKDLPKMFSPELALKINQLQLANLSVK
jgi:predicted ATP-binding protein involved in virulence